MGQPEAWEQQPAETPKAFDAFRTYRDMGPQRSIDKAMLLAGANPTSKRVWENWSAQNCWVRRALAWDAECDRVRREQELETVREMARRQAEDAVALQELLRDARESVLAEMKPQDWVSAWKTAVQIERLARGEPTDKVRTEHEGHLTADGQSTNIAAAILMDAEATKFACALAERLASGDADTGQSGEVREPGPVAAGETPEPA